mmetsp:Transcript_15015/g.37993  ORF Transcript_15015/g.37993 Transcript_15015/m.37993 type:complete len:166 (+) Transcript_15015:125-622(+)
MAANFWKSSHCTQWLLDPSVSPFYKHDLEEFTPIELAKIHSEYASIIQRIGSSIRLQCPRRVVATAIVYFKRFYKRNSLTSYNPDLVAPTCLYFACKVEEFLVSAQQVVQACDEVLAKWKETELLSCELLLLDELRHGSIVFHPYSCLDEYIVDLAADCVKEEAR